MSVRIFINICGEEIWREIIKKINYRRQIRNTSSQIEKIVSSHTQRTGEDEDEDEDEPCVFMQLNFIFHFLFWFFVLE